MTTPCPACAAANPATGRFCEECGTPLALACASCGAAVTVGKKFCGACGTSLTGAARSPDEPPVESTSLAERRVCSVLFCDLVGFTPLSESRDAEEVRELLSRYFDTASTVIRRYGGVVEKFIGDAVMAVWGTPVAVEGDTERAVRAALELVAAVAALGAETNAPALAARAGVVTGEVAVSVGAVNEGMVAGDVVNTAARVQSVAAAGSVLVDATTQRLAQAGVEFSDAGEFALKGKTDPQRLWRAGRVLSNVGGAQRVDGLEAPLTGRDPEMRLIKDLFHACVDRRQLRLVAVTGSAGVGKSRLGWEFEKYIDGLADAVWWHRGRCLSYGDGVSFWALAEIVRQRLDIAEEDPVEVASGKLREGLDRYLANPGERDYVGLRLARLLGLPFGEEGTQELSPDELFAGWRLWFERLAESSPVVLLVEDLHHADAGMLDFLDHLIDWGRDAAIFVLTFGRPEMRAERASWGTGRNRTQLALDPLDATSMGALLDSLVPGLPPAAAAAIAEQAQGIPLFAVETIRTLIDRDVVVPSEGVYRLVGELGSLGVPDSLHGLLAARLDALSTDVRSAVADAAVLGSTFPAQALAAISGRSDAKVRDVLSDLVRRGVLEVVADPLSPQRGTYRFGHDMLRQVAYDTLSRHDRRARHLLVAAHLIATFPNDGEEVADVIARHYLDALAAVPDAPDVETTRTQAIEQLVRAGERAKRIGARARAEANFAEAAELLETSTSPDAAARAAKLWEKAAEAAQWDSNHRLSMDRIDRARATYLTLGDARAAARCDAGAARALRNTGRYAEARERVELALSVLRQNPDLDTVEALVQLGGLESLAGSEAADRVSTETLALAQMLDAPPTLLGAACVGRAIALQNAGLLLEAAMYMREAARLSELAGDRDRQSIALSNVADILCAVDATAAAAAAREAAAVSRRSGGAFSLALAVQCLVVALAETGDWDGAAAELSEAIENDGIGEQDFVLYAAARLAATRGDVETARSTLARMDYMRTSEDPQDRGFVALVEAFIALAEERDAAALAKAQEALSLAPAVGMNPEFVRWGWSLAARAAHDLHDDTKVAELLHQLDSYRPGQLPPMLHAEAALARVRQAARRAEAGVGAQFAEAVTGLRKRSTPFHLAHGMLDHAGYLISSGESDDAMALIEEARQIGERLGARPLVERATSMTAARDAVG